MNNCKMMEDNTAIKSNKNQEGDIGFGDIPQRDMTDFLELCKALQIGEDIFL
jgi:hypothetical protein